MGDKSPVVIFENGMASTFETWNQIPDSISKKATVLLYNRAGLGNSDSTQTKRTIPNMVEDLNALLKQRDLQGPYLFVAHSMGSYLSRYFALTHPKKVSGILLVDPSPDTMYDEYTEQETQDFLAFGNENFKNSSQGAKDEWNNYLNNRKFVQKPISQDIPITILSATQWDFYKYHESILNKNPNSKHLKIEGSHDLHHDRPDKIIEEINRLIGLSYQSK
jgi:pimeloyl-ACP methyl ester carboxylesterase